MRTVKIAVTARQDIAKTLRISESEFGVSARACYKSLIDQAISDLAEDVARPGTRRIDDIREGYFIYHLKMSRGNVVGEAVGRPRHFLLYRLGNVDTLIIARLLHERMLLKRHLSITSGESSSNTKWTSG